MIIKTRIYSILLNKYNIKSIIIINIEVLKRRLKKKINVY